MQGIVGAVGGAPNELREGGAVGRCDKREEEREDGPRPGRDGRRWRIKGWGAVEEMRGGTRWGRWKGGGRGEGVEAGWGRWLSQQGRLL